MKVEGKDREMRASMKSWHQNNFVCLCLCMCVCAHKGGLCLYTHVILLPRLISSLSISWKKRLGNIGRGSRLSFCHGTSFLLKYLEMSPYSLMCTHVQHMKHNSCNT